MLPSILTFNPSATWSAQSKGSKLPHRTDSSSAFCLVFLRYFNLIDASTSSEFIPTFKHLEYEIAPPFLRVQLYLLVKPAPLTAPPTSPVNPTISCAFHTAVGLVQTSPEEGSGEKYQNLFYFPPHPLLCPTCKSSRSLLRSEDGMLREQNTLSSSWRGNSGK